ncbi:unnamed protein product [Effrenium voratum]|uniref:Calmodulin n=1 Tax=Effrenium voratum TaxID=2562239 RepID=A0AA36I1W8_9DINO|nr:unnamed protein product [Effrenium voratum]
MSDAFEVFDIDGSGDIDTAEISALLRLLGDTTDAQHLIQGADTQKRGTIRFEDFLALMKDLKASERWKALLSFSQAQIEDYRDAFALFDKDQSGGIDPSELRALLKLVGHSPSKDELDAMIQELDKNESGAIEFNEFLYLMTKRERGSAAADVAEAFRIYDRDRTGYISVENLQFMLTRLGENFTDEEVSEMLQEADKDRDGKVTFKDFEQMMTFA